MSMHREGFTAMLYRPHQRNGIEGVVPLLLDNGAGLTGGLYK
jgi:hypothetical protein